MTHLESSAKSHPSTDTLKKQTKQQQEEYNRLSDELAKATGNTSTKKD